MKDLNIEIDTIKRLSNMYLNMPSDVKIFKKYNSVKTMKMFYWNIKSFCGKHPYR